MESSSATATELLADGAMGVPEAAKFCGLSRAEIYRRMAARELPSVKHGRRRLVPKVALVEMLAKGLTVQNADAAAKAWSRDHGGK